MEPGARAEDPVGLGIARASADAAAIVPGVVNLLDVMLRQHLIAARRTILGDIEGLAFETQHLYVGFVDVVGSTALAQRLPPAELGSVLTEFENTASDAMTANRGRVVKLIGDEVLYSAPDVAAAFAIARTLTSTYLDHPRLPKVRAGIAGGEVMLRDGDVFGPVVNLAARAVKAAGPDEIVAPSAIATEAGIDTEPLGPQALKGFDGEVPLARLLPDSPG